MEAYLALATLVVVLILVAWGRWRLELCALGGLFFLGVSGGAPSSVLLSGFGHSALMTMAAVMVISQAIIDSGLLKGLGLALNRRLSSSRGQILGLSLLTAGISSLINNVGAVALMLPTGGRMARRLRLAPGAFGLPLALGAIIGGSMTLVGTGPNMLISGFRQAEMGSSFRMFDFLPVGLGMVLAASLAWVVCRSCGFLPGDQELPLEDVSSPPDAASQLPQSKRIITAVIAGVAVATVSAGWLPSDMGFGGAALLMIFSGVIRIESAYASLDWPILLFIGAMLGISAALTQSGALAPLDDWLASWVDGMPAIWIIAILFFASSILANSTNNAAAAVTMAPVALMVAGQAGNVSVDALLMAVAVGSGLSIILPTHQAALLARRQLPFSLHTYARAGLLLTLLCGVVAVALIRLIW